MKAQDIESGLVLVIETDEADRLGLGAGGGLGLRFARTTMNGIELLNHTCKQSGRSSGGTPQGVLYERRDHLA
jgi:hypothetical protein